MRDNKFNGLFFGGDMAVSLPWLEDITLEDLSQHTFVREPGKSCVVQGDEGQSRCPLGAPRLLATSPCCEPLPHPAATSQRTFCFIFPRDIGSE